MSDGGAMQNINRRAIVLTSTFRAGMSFSLAVILGIVTLGTTFIDAHLTEIKDIAGDILRAYPMLSGAGAVWYLRASLFAGSHHAADYPSCRRARRTHMGHSDASYVAVTGVFVSANLSDFAGGNGVRHHRDNARG